MTDQLDLDRLERLAKAAEADWNGETITPNTVAHFHHLNPTVALALISQAREAERMRGALRAIAFDDEPMDVDGIVLFARQALAPATGGGE